MKFYFHIYKTLFKMNFSALTAYRANLVNSLVGDIVWGSFHFISITLLTSRTKHILNWPREDVILLTAAFSIFWGVFHIIFGRNFERMSQLIDRGQLDGTLLKPIDSQFLLSTSLINFTGLFRVILGIVATVYIITSYHMQVSILSLIGFFMLLICGLILIYSIWFIILTLTVWFARLSNLVDLLFNISGIMRYPPDIFRTLNEFVILFLLPMLLIISTPVKLLLHKAMMNEIGYVVGFTVFFFFVSREFWKYALRHYTSASG